MRGVKVILAVLAVIIIVAAALVLFRKPVASFALRQVMDAQNLPTPDARVTALSLNQIRIENLSSAPSDSPDAPLLQFDYVDIAFDLVEAITARRVSSINLGPGVIRVDISDDGVIQIAGIPVSDSGDRSGSAAPFDALTASGLEIEIWSPEGVATSKVDAAYDIDGAGKVDATFKSDRVGLHGYAAEGASAAVHIALREDGAAEAMVRFVGGIRSPYGQMRNAEFVVDGEGSSWKNLAAGDWRAFVGNAEISVLDALLEAENAPLAGGLNAYANVLGGPFDALNIAGDFTISAEQGVINVEKGERPFMIEADTGARLSIDAAMGEPLVMWGDKGIALAGVLSVRGGDISATATFDAHQADNMWFFNAPVSVGALEMSTFAMSDASAVIRGTAAQGVIEFEATASGEIISAEIGRFSISDAPGAMSVRGVFDNAAKSIALHLPDNQCAALQRLSLSIAGQDMDASLRGARLCGLAAPLATVRLGENPTTVFSGLVTAESGRYRLGQTRFVGKPPAIELSGRYLPAENQTTARGIATGGSVVMNDLLRFDRAEGTLDFALVKNAMTIKTSASRIRMTEYGVNAKVAPIYAKGSMTLADDIARFDYVALTEGAVALGQGVGEHNIKTAAGSASFTFNRLVFAAGGLQPDKLAPVLKGIIGLTQGAAEGTARFSWAPDGIKSYANLSFDNITFRGPGLTVTKTAGVNGDIAFASLWPVATDGAQTVSVAGVDFGALQLENGEIVFDMPGDDTLLVERAIFPWFGGQIGVRSATATFTGGNALAPLRVEAVDLKQVLEFIDVEGLSGAGTLNGDLPLVVENSRASFVGGELSAAGPGRISYVGKAGAAAAEAGSDAQIAFDLLRDLRFDTLSILINGPLDGRLDFQINFDGTGEVSYNRSRTRVPVKYNIALETALLDFIRQANLSRDIELQVNNAVRIRE